MNKLSISEVEFKNFLSYGDYTTKIKLDGLGPTLIVGDRSDGDSKDLGKSNGAGKSTITTAILWALFGKTFSLGKPGDKVVNWAVDKNCQVIIRTTDGWKITRTRKMEGRNELSIEKDGEDKTLSTPTNTQRFLDSHFGLDFDIFTSSVFFGQFSKPFLEMSDPKRRAALERLLNLDKLNVWASVAKDKTDKIDVQLSKATSKVTSQNEELERLNAQKDSINDHISEFEEERKATITGLEATIEMKSAERDEIVIPDIEKLRSKWAAIGKITERLSQYEEKRRRLQTSVENLQRMGKDSESNVVVMESQLKQAKSYDLIELEAVHKRNEETQTRKNALEAELAENGKALTREKAHANANTRDIEKWEQESGKICQYCKQEITEAHVASECMPLHERRSELNGIIADLTSRVDELEKEIDELPPVVQAISIREAKSVNAATEELREEVTKLKDTKGGYAAEINGMEKEIASIDRLVERVQGQMQSAAPDITIDEAVALESKKALILQEISSLNASLSAQKDLANPHNKSLELIESQISEVQGLLVETEKAKTKLHALYSHLSYIKSAYKDRNKIKSFILLNLIPILNQRIQYYLEAFNCDFAMEFTPSLSVLPSKWDYTLCSGGERKRIDMAMMFGLYDLYIHMYGQQCSLMVLDEVDGRLDTEGIESFIDVIYNDFHDSSDSRPRPDTVLVISHRPEMLDAFPTKIMVKKRDGFSFIESVI